MSSSSLPLLTNDASTWHGQSLLSVDQISMEGMDLLMTLSKQCKTLVENRGDGGCTILQHTLLATVFFEASTRTSASFQAAISRLGGNYMDIHPSSSSLKKGESLEDTLTCMACYSDILVVRHSEQGRIQQALDNIHNHQPNIQLINAGDGIGEHPTQALLDVFTIVQEFKSLDLKNLNSTTSPLIVVMVGDLKHGRTVHSLARLLAKLFCQNNLELRYCAPPGLEMPLYIQDEISTQYPSVQQVTCSKLDSESLQDAHVLYVTRIQKERFDSLQEYDMVKDSYIVDAEIMKQAPNQMVVMHPLPRVNEISTEVDKDPRAAYFRQMKNGMYVRMALLILLLGKVEEFKAFMLL